MIETEKKEGFKQTKLGWIPKEWEVTCIGKISTIDNNSLKSSTDENLEFKYISLSDVTKGKISDRLQQIKYKDAPSRAKRRLKLNSILLATVRPNLQNFAIFNNEDSNDYIASTGFSIIDVKDSYNAVFLYNYLFIHQMTKQFYSLVVGSNYPAINTFDVRNLKIPLPPLPEQQKIAEILSTWDTAITNTQELITQLKSRKKGLMQQLLTGRLRLRSASGEPFSGEWEEVEFSKIASRITDKNLELHDNVVTISAQRGFVRQEDYFNKRVASSTLSGYYLISEGEFAYNKSYSKGYPMGAFKRLNGFEKAVVTTLYVCFRLNENKADSDFMVNFFEGGMMINGLMKIAQEGGRAHGLLNISLGDFFGLKFKLPSIAEQKAISTILNLSDTEIKSAENKLTSLQNQKKGLMQQLLTGQKRVVS